MNTRIRAQEAEPRLMSITELCSYLSVGKSLARRFAENCGATLRIGRSLRFDRKIIDRALDAQKQQDIKWLD